MPTTQPFQQSITPTSPTELITVKSATCKSLSGKSDLSYHIACDSDNEIYFRIADNSGNGFFSCEWIALSAIEKAIENRPTMSGITALTLTPLFKGKSVNTPAFLLAALMAENLVQPLPNRRRAFEPIPNKAFITEIYALVDAGAEIATTETTPTKSSKKSASASKVSGSTGSKKS